MIAIDGNKAVELVNTIPMLGLINDIVEVFLIDPDTNKFSVTNITTFFSLNFFYLFL